MTVACTQKLRDGLLDYLTEPHKKKNFTLDYLRDGGQRVGSRPTRKWLLPLALKPGPWTPSEVAGEAPST